MSRFSFFSAAAVAFLTATVLSFAAAPAPPRVSLKSSVEPKTAPPGGVVTLQLAIDVKPSYHLYSPDSPNGIPSTVKLADGSRAVLEGALVFPAPIVEREEGWDEPSRIFHGAVQFTQALRLPADAKAGDVIAVKGTLDGQACDASSCLPVSLPFETSVTIAAPAPTTPTTPTVAVAESPAKRTAPAAEARVTMGASVALDRAAAGDAVTLKLQIEVHPTYHLYAPDSPPEGGGRPASIQIEANSRFAKDGALVFPSPHEILDPALGTPVRVFESGRLVLEQRLRVPADAKPGETVALRGKFLGSACDDRTCEDIALPFDLSVTILAGAPAAAGSRTEPPIVASSTTARPSIGSFLLSAIGAALLALLMPCVFPMIPITVSVFSKQAGGSRARAISLATIYCVGIIATFTILGVVAAAFAGPQIANALATNPWVNLALAGMFVLFGLSLLGAFEIRMPQFLVSRAAEAQQKQTGVGAVLLMGFVFTLTSFTCTVQFVGTLLVQAAQGERLWPILGMLTFSATFALPFFFLALFPSLLSTLPQAGGWMNAVKATLGLVEIGAAMKFFSNADMVWDAQMLTRPLFLAVWIGIAAVTTLYLLGRVRMSYDDESTAIGPGRAVTALVFASLTIYLASGFFGTKFGDQLEGWLPPPDYGHAVGAGGAVAGASDELPFIESYADARARAIAEKKPLFLDFTGVACNNCRAMERNVFPRSDVREQLARFVRAKLWVDKGADKEFNARLQTEKWDVASQPFYVMLDPVTETTLETFPGYAPTEAGRIEFRDTLKRAADRYHPAN